MAEKTLSKEEWARVEKALGGIYGRAKLQVDGREVILSRELVDKNRLAVVVYVDGSWRGEWVGKTNDCPEQRYLCPRDRFAYEAKYRADLKRLGKRFRKKYDMPDPDRKVRVWYPWFLNATAIRRHYQKTFQSIELIEVLGA